MNKFKKISHKKLNKLLHESDDELVLLEMVRRIKSGLIPLAYIAFVTLSSRKLWRLVNLADCDWALNEIVKRMKDGRIPSRKVTLEEVRKELAHAKFKHKQAS